MCSDIHPINSGSGEFDAVVLLAHLMDKDGKLGVETKKRADAAVKLAREANCRLVLMGWAYRPDSQICISDAMACYATERHSFPTSLLMIDRQSRDTVGDAIFSKRMLQPIAVHRRIGVVTSNYHVERTRRVFTFVYGDCWSVDVSGAPVDVSTHVLAHELKSIEAFERTFEGVQGGDDTAIVSRLISRHPFYNGNVHQKLTDF